MKKKKDELRKETKPQYSQQQHTEKKTAPNDLGYKHSKNTDYEFRHEADSDSEPRYTDEDSFPIHNHDEDNDNDRTWLAWGKGRVMRKYNYAKSLGNQLKTLIN